MEIFSANVEITPYSPVALEISPTPKGITKGLKNDIRRN